MRLGRTLGAALGAVALIMSVPSSAHATEGNFDYSYGDPANPTDGQLVGPDDEKCFEANELPGSPTTAFHPRNGTSTEAAVYSDEFCTGTKTVLKAHDGEGATDLVFKSVIFKAEGN